MLTESGQAVLPVYRVAALTHHSVLLKLSPASDLDAGTEVSSSGGATSSGAMTSSGEEGSEAAAPMKKATTPEGGVAFWRRALRAQLVAGLGGPPPKMLAALRFSFA